MNENVNTLKSVFTASKQELLDNLKGLSLPKDSSKIEKIVTDYLSGLFENEGGFRQTLTEAEDFVLQSVLRLLQSQQDIAKELQSLLMILTVAVLLPQKTRKIQIRLDHMRRLLGQALVQ